MAAPKAVLLEPVVVHRARLGMRAGVTVRRTSSSGAARRTNMGA
jgi:hypothetical protein